MIFTLLYKKGNGQAWGGHHRSLGHVAHHALEEDNIIISKNGGRSVHYLLNKNNCGYQTQSICPSGVDATG